MSLLKNDTKAVADKWFKALRERDGASAMECLDKNVVWSNTKPIPGLSEIIPWLGEYHGVGEVHQTFMVWAKLSEVESFELLELFINGDEAIGLVHEKAKIIPTGLYYDIEFIHRLTVEDGKIVRWKSYWDTAFGIVAFRGDLNERLLGAVLSKDRHSARELLKFGADPNYVNPGTKLTLLMTAAGTGETEIASMLLRKGANPNTLDELAGASAMHKACQGGYLEIVKLLAEHGAFINTQAVSTGHTPLIEAIWFKYPEIVQYLLDNGAWLNIKTNYGFSLLDHLNYALNVSTRCKDKLYTIKDMVDKRIEDDRKRAESQKLMQAVIDNKCDEVKACIGAGADVNERAPILNGFNDGHTPLHVACRSGFYDIAKILIEAGADINAIEPTFGAVPLHKATYNGFADITQLLCSQAGINMDYQGPSNGYTPLHDALWHGFDKCAEVLVNSGCALKLRGHDGLTPYDLALEVFGDKHPLTVKIMERSGL
ncbi:ankyrin repeat domain-containing protein [Seleniivibrio woodruffii]|uniref:ankyrin repeat domain-containing protein n=1 Tax=Seleniivibrio woodruffii TaxID=1078050 RepID=UPI0039E61412